ncbi:hypothetical protein [Flavobacterium sp. PL002]|uniref:hypothetical protein n=1 Tax=Flavobacterium sp. PL002 TaxID=1897058 RepID=UPI0017877FB5|nr:hypothetical protein [Flavobacterium sp. PL002]MBE0390227.1 hypothetical protein [Flavobacterium sp. PL002]
MTIFIEPFRKPNEHMTFLVSLLYGELAQNKKVVFYATTDYYNSIPEEFRNKIEFREIKSPNSSSDLIFKIIKLTISILRKYKKEPGVKLFLLSSRAYSNIFLKIHSLFFIKRVPVFVFLHGELQHLMAKKSLSHRLDGLAQLILYKVDSVFKSNYKFVVISEFVYEKLCLSVNSALPNFISMDLPYYYGEEMSKSSTEISSGLTISTVGVNSLNKNSHYLNFIAEAFSKEIINEQLKLFIIGRNENIEFHDLIDVPDLGKHHLLDPEAYSKRILQSDLLVFFNEDNKYNLISSGSYFDCIKYRKPMIALKNTQWEYNFNKFGVIGKLFDNIDEMNDFIKNILYNKELITPYYEKLDQARNNSDIVVNIQKYAEKFQEE